jgi:hypothetical protein
VEQLAIIYVSINSQVTYGERFKQQSIKIEISEQFIDVKPNAPTAIDGLPNLV